MTNVTQLLDEIIERHPNAIRSNAIRLGFMQDDDTFDRTSLIQAIYKWRNEHNPTPFELKHKLFRLFSLEFAVNDLSSQLAQINTNIHKESWLPLIILLLFGMLIGIILSNLFK